MRSIVDSTADFERWLASQTALVPEDLEVKHQRMAEDLFPFLRATFYRWAEVWPIVCAELDKGLQLLGVGDLHVQNFGTWRDTEGRLVWGVNDFDEADHCCFAVDLVRLAVSAQLAARQDNRILLSFDQATEAIFAGYRQGVELGGRPFVLEGRHEWLRRLAHSALKVPQQFWETWLEKKTAPVRRENDIPSSARTALLSSFPETKQVEFRWRGNASKPKGLGSLGQMRFFAFVEWRGGPIAREVKLSRPSAWAWAQGKTSAGNAIMTLIHKAVRSPDPLVSMHDNWLVRAIAAECGRIDLDEVDKAGIDAQRRDDHQRLLNAMGFETANIHLGSACRNELTAALKNFQLDAFRQACRRMLEAVEQDYAAWAQYWQKVKK